MTRRKWKSRRGETLIETLVSLFISSLALTMLASMVLTSTNLLKKGMETMDAYTQKINYLNAPTHASNPLTSGGAATITTGGATATIKISSVSGGAAVLDMDITVPNVQYVLLEELGETVISYTVNSGG